MTLCHILHSPRQLRLVRSRGEDSALTESDRSRRRPRSTVSITSQHMFTECLAVHHRRTNAPVQLPRLQKQPDFCHNHFSFTLSEAMGNFSLGRVETMMLYQKRYILWVTGTETFPPHWAEIRTGQQKEWAEVGQKAAALVLGQGWPLNMGSKGRYGNNFLHVSVWFMAILFIV